MRTAKFVVEGRARALLCPYCQTKVTASDGKTTQIVEDAGKYWAEMSKEKWVCKSCHQRFALPANPFKTPERQAHA